MIRAGYPLGHRCLPLVLSAAFVATRLQAQETSPDGLGLQIAARSGFLTTPSDVAVSKSTTQPLLNMTQAGLLANWHIGFIETTASLSLASASAFGTQGTLPIGLLHVAVRHGPFTLMLGLEQSVGVAANIRARAKQNTTPTDTTKGFAQGVPGRDSVGSGTSPTSVTQFGLTSGLATTSAALVRTADAVGGIGWEHGRTRLALIAGLQTADLTSSGAWISATADIAVGDGAAMTLSLRQESQNATVQTPAVSLGLRLVHWPTIFTRRSKPVPASATGGSQLHGVAALPIRVDVADSMVHLHVLLQGVHQVVIAGDLTDWQPAAMTDEQKGWWGIQLPRTDGVSRLHLRSDGGDWTPVPGLPTTPDEYGGTVSLLVLSPKAAPASSRPSTPSPALTAAQ